jgi:hypothetical protein
MNHEAREFLRHTIATLAYRCGKTLRDAPADFAIFKIEQTVNTPLFLLSHIADLLEWALTAARGEPKYPATVIGNWELEKQRFYAALKALDDFLASKVVINASLEKIFQGPIADALTHTGQLALLRRMAGSSIKGENYFVADITTGLVREDQPAPKREF